MALDATQNQPITLLGPDGSQPDPGSLPPGTSYKPRGVRRLDVVEYDANGNRVWGLGSEEGHAVPQEGVFNPKDYGAVGNESIATTGSISAGSTHLTVASAAGFSIGNYLTAVGAGAKTVAGTISSGSNQLTLSSAIGFTLDTYVRVAGAGDSGSLLFAQIRSIDGNVLTLSENASTTVVDANVTNDGVLYDAKVTSIGDNLLTLDRAASATVTNVAVQVDDHPAFVACLEAIRAQNNPLSYGALWSGAKMVVPPGAKDPRQSAIPWGLGYFGYRMSRPLHITSCCVIEGEGGYHFPASILHFDSAATGIIVDSVQNRGLAHGHARGDGSVIRQLGIVGSAAFSGVVPSIAGGTYPKPWEPGVSVSAGEVRVPSVYRQNLWGKAILCLAGGTTASGYLNEPNWNSGGGDAGVYTESTSVAWKLIDCDGIYVEAPCKVEDCFVYAFSGNGINYQALGYPQAVANNAKILNNKIVLCGGNGIRANGNDANQGLVQGNDVDQCYGYGYVDTTLLSCIWVANHGAECLRGPAWFDHGRIYGHYAEGGQGPVVLTSQATWVHGIAGGNNGDGFNSSYKLLRGSVWSAGGSVAPDSIVYPTVDNGYFYWASTAGTKGMSEPTWPLGRGKTVLDGTVLWYCYGPSAFQQNLNILHQNTMTPTRFRNTAGQYIMQLDAATANADEFIGWKSGIDSAGLTNGYSLVGIDAHGVGWQALAWNRGAGQPFCLSTQRAVDDGTAKAAGMLMLPGEHYIGSQYASRILELVGTAPPASTAYLLGSYTRNANPAANGIVGWICVIAGSPGTWSPVTIVGGRLGHNMASNADYTLSASEQFSGVIEITDTGVLLTTTRNIILPTWDGAVRTVYNSTLQSLVFKTSGGAGITVAAGKRAMGYVDGSGAFVRISPDT